ncbi:hypothetical protein CBR_g16847 [Chara braunii]|uniref:Uncharacterized protein n=1 Tax=Chara braunii TaxID=69332 RepID=A0A388KTW2_CHABU|nr:hypothetical protein CBR_g16847 [Chara braunii]|eukprot:GBG73504.1 hypothetical protein CBR_g16847 [Chara braunii]
MELNVRCLNCGCDLRWVCVIGQCHRPQNGDDEVILWRANDVDKILWNRRDDSHNPGDDNDYNADDVDDDDVAAAADDDDVDDDDDDDDNHDEEDNDDMGHWNQKTGDGKNDGENLKSG